MTIGNIIGTIKKIKPSGRRIMKRRETILGEHSKIEY